MKKLFSVFIAVILIFTCMLSTYAATNTATPDGAEPTVTSINIAKLPDKTSYTLFQDAGWDIKFDNIEDFKTFYEFADYILNAPFYIDVDLSGAVIDIMYSNGMVVQADVSKCKTSVKDPVRIGDIDATITYEEFEKLILREYTIVVEYEGAEATFNVNINDIGFSDEEYSEVYEFVSYDDPNQKEYVIGKDTYKDSYYDIDDKEIFYETLDFDLTDITVTVKNIETGELETYGEDSIFLDFFYPYDDTEAPLTPGTYFADGTVFTDDGELVTFEYSFKLINEEGETLNKPKPSENNKNNGEVSDTATYDTANKATSADSGAVQTGNPVSAVILVLIMMSGSTFAIFCTKKRIDK